MILLLGATGYIGSAFASALTERGWPFRTLSRSQLDYTRFDLLFDHLRLNRPEFVVNAAGYTGKPNVDACEEHKADTLAGNTLLPQTIGQACAALDISWGHVSSGCIYAGARVTENGATRIEKDLTRPELRALAEEQPGAITGFREHDEPNFTFRQPPCSFYSGTKALAEEAIGTLPCTFIWRLRIPFDELDNPRNYLTKIQRYSKVYDNVNSISHRGDFVRACLDLWQRRAPFGVYNVTNPGFVTTRQVVRLIEARLRLRRTFEFWESDEEFYRVAAKTPRSNCVMDTGKLVEAGVAIRPVNAALEDALARWQPAPGSSPGFPL